MMTQHVTDQELQQYAMDKAGCAAGSVQHIESCEACRAGAAAGSSPWPPRRGRGRASGPWPVPTAPS